MNDRKLRAIGALSSVSGVALVLVSLALFWSNLDPTVTLPVFIIYSVIQYRLAPYLFKIIYESKWIDLPSRLRKRFPPRGFDDSGGTVYDVILLRPPSAVLSGPDCGEALGLGYLANVLREQGQRVLLIDARLMELDMMQTVELLLAYEAPMLGVNLNFQYLAPSTIQLIKTLNQRGFSGHITLGGLFASVAYEALMSNTPQIDTIVRFEGERTYAELIQNVATPAKWPDINGLVYRDKNEEVQVNPLRSLISDLDTIPYSARDFLPIASSMGGYAYVLSSRGCKGVCSYCVQQCSVTQPQGQRWRGRDPELVADEVQQIVKEYDTRLFSFVDDDFIGPKTHGQNHASQVAEALIDRDLDISILLSIQPRDVIYDEFSLLKKAGVESVILAVDNFSQSVLDRYRKFTTVAQNKESIEILQSLEIDAYLGIIMFDPWTSLEELVQNFEALKKMPFLRPWQILSKLEIYDGSPITIELQEQGLLKWENYSAGYEFLDNRIQNVYLAIEIIMKLLHPSMSQLDQFRWGNLSFSEADTLILKHFKNSFLEFNTDYNRQALELALEIVGRQQQFDDPIPVNDLADRNIQRRAEILNQQALREITKMRKEVMDQHEHMGITSPSIAMLES